MAFTGSYICTSFYQDLLNGVINFGSDTIRMALYNSTATLNASTTAYTATGELSAALGYSTGGVAITPAVTVVGTPGGNVVVLDFSDASWAAASFTARGGLIYDDTAAGNPAIAVIDFGSDKTGDGVNPFVVTMPPPTANAGFFVFQTVLTTV